MENNSEHNGISPIAITVGNVKKIKVSGEKFGITLAVAKPHSEILPGLLEKVKVIDFREKAGITDDKEKLKAKHFLIIVIETVLELAKTYAWGLCKNLGFTYLYNGAYWAVLSADVLQKFLGQAAEKMGVDKADSRYFQFQEQLKKQFQAAANLPTPEPAADRVLINVRNGTYDLCRNHQLLRPARSEDFLTHVLNFEYDPTSEAPQFLAFLNRVQPDINNQKILAEYLAYAFIRNSMLKLEKALLLYGGGANGKSVFFEVVTALFGSENVSHYSLQNLTNENGYYRAMIANKLVNYASETPGKHEISKFKQLASGEPIDARSPYGEPFIITNYARLIFNCNELPRDVEQTNAYFRRFLIIPFDVTIPESEQDKELSKKIIETELSGVFNWVLSGLRRLLSQKNFTVSEAVTKQLEAYKLHSDSVQMFLAEEGFKKDINETMEFKEVYGYYRQYCIESGYYACSKRTFSDRLKNGGYEFKRDGKGIHLYITKELFSEGL